MTNLWLKYEHWSKQSRVSGTCLTCTGTCWPKTTRTQHVPVQVQGVPVHVTEKFPECVFSPIFPYFSTQSTLYSIYTSRPLQIHLVISFILKSSFNTYLSSKPFMIFFSKNNSNMGHNPYTNQIQGFVKVCSSPNSFTLQLNYESNLKGRIPCFSRTIWGFTHLTLNDLWVRMKSYQNPRKIKCQQETHVGMKFYKTLGLGQATNHAIVWKFIQEFIVPYLGLLELLSFFHSSLLLLFLFLFFSLFLFPLSLYGLVSQK